MVSGIGPKAELERHNIPVIVEKPGVGQNMWDHVLFGVVYEANLSTTAILQDPMIADGYDAEYIANATGILTSQNADYLAWEKLPANLRANLSPAAREALTAFPPDWPEIEYVIGSFPVSNKLSSKNYVYIESALITPLSRGNVSISSADMNDPPLIDVGWLTNPTDLEVLTQAMKRARSIYESDAVRPILIGEEALPGKHVTTDEQIANYIKNDITTVYHASCTCKLFDLGFCFKVLTHVPTLGKMGNSSDPMAVVDSKARVFGVQGLRVVDASAFPLLVPGHPQSTIYALAEKIASDIMGQSM